MTKTRKIPPAIKGQITKLFKAGMLLPDLKVKIAEKLPWVTTERIKTVLKAHFMDHCDHLWSEAVKLKAGNICIIDQKRCSLNSHHLIGRINYKYRWDVDNGVCLGIYRHTLAHDMAAHGSTAATLAFATRMENSQPMQWAWFQDHRYDHEMIKVDVYYLLETAKRLEKEIEALKNSPQVDILERRKVD
jgi:hypothetical protein